MRKRQPTVSGRRFLCVGASGAGSGGRPTYLRPLHRSTSRWGRTGLRPSPLSPLGEACLQAGRLRDARESLERAIELGERLDMRLIATPAERLLGEVLLADGEPGSLERAQGHFERAMQGFERSRAENELALAWAGYGRLQARLGRPAQARQYFGKALAIFERLGTMNQPERVRAEIAALAYTCTRDHEQRKIHP